MNIKKNCEIDPRIAFFDNLAKNWDNEELSSEEMTTRLSQNSTLLDLKSGDNLLEVGCGTGKTTCWLAPKIAPGTVTAIDFSPAMIAKAQKKKIDAEFLCLDICSNNIGQKSFDVILCFHCFPHFRNQAVALQNLARSLKPSGRLIVMHLAGSEHINNFHVNLDGPVNNDILPQGDDWILLLGQAGLERIQLIDREDLFFLKAVHHACQKS